MNKFISDEAVCRTAPAEPVLLNTLKIFFCVLLVTRWGSSEVTDSPYDNFSHPNYGKDRLHCLIVKCGVINKQQALSNSRTKKLAIRFYKNYFSALLGDGACF